MRGSENIMKGKDLVFVGLQELNTSLIKLSKRFKEVAGEDICIECIDISNDSKDSSPYDGVNVNIVISGKKLALGVSHKVSYFYNTGNSAGRRGCVGCRTEISGFNSDELDLYSTKLLNNCRGAVSAFTSCVLSYVKSIGGTNNTKIFFPREGYSHYYDKSNGILQIALKGNKPRIVTDEDYDGNIRSIHIFLKYYSVENKYEDTEQRERLSTKMRKDISLFITKYKYCEEAKGIIKEMRKINKGE